MIKEVEVEKVVEVERVVEVPVEREVVREIVREVPVDSNLPRLCRPDTHRSINTS